MQYLDLLHNLFFDYTVRTVALGAAILGLVSGILGSFAVLRRQSLLGDAISHAALPGIAIAFLITRSKAPLVLVLGAIASGWIGTILVIIIIKHSRIKDDSALGIVLSVFFGLGLLLLTIIQKMPDATQAGLDKFLFGQAATLLARDVFIMAILGLITLFMVLILWKEFKLFTFDPEFASTQGFPVRIINIILTSLLVVAIVIGLQTVGVVLMSAMVVAPAVAARQWTDRFHVMVLLSGIFGAAAGVAGALISSGVSRMPTGPTIVICISFFVAVSIFLAPNRGIAWSWVREMKDRRRLQEKAILDDLYILSTQHTNLAHGHPIQVLRAMSIGHGGVDRSLRDLSDKGFAKKDESGNWSLTDKGLEYLKSVALQEKHQH